MTDPTPQEAEARTDRAVRRFLAVTTVIFAVTVLAVGVILGFLVHQLDVHFAEQQHAAQARSAELERQNERIHQCLAAKEDQFRRDVAALLTNPHGGIPSVDNINCAP